MGRGRGSMGKRRGGEQCFRVCVYVCGCIACPVRSSHFGVCLLVLLNWAY